MAPLPARRPPSPWYLTIPLTIFAGLPLLLPDVLHDPGMFIVFGSAATVLLGAFIAPFAFFWIAARDSDRKLQEDAGPQPAPLQIGAAGGPLAAAPPPKPPVKFSLMTPEWLLSTLGIVGVAGLPPSLWYARGDLALVFASTFVVGFVGWLVLMMLKGKRGQAESSITFKS